MPRMVVFDLYNPKKYCLGSLLAHQKPIPLYPIVQQRCFWIPRMVVFELRSAKEYCLVSGVAPQTHLPAYPTGQHRCFWLPRMVVFGLRSAKKYCFVLWGGAPNTQATILHRPGKVFLDP